MVTLSCLKPKISFFEKKIADKIYGIFRGKTYFLEFSDEKIYFLSFYEEKLIFWKFPGY